VKRISKITVSREAISYLVSDQTYERTNDEIRFTLHRCGEVKEAGVFVDPDREDAPDTYLT
jgi:hypothetical protein